MCSGNAWFVPAAARGKSAEAAAEGSQLGLTAARGLSSLYNNRARAVVTVRDNMMSLPLYAPHTLQDQYSTFSQP